RLFSRFSAPQVSKTACGLAAQVFVLCTLDHTEQRLVRAMAALRGLTSVLVEAAHGPPFSARDRIFLVAAGVEKSGAFVEREDDVCAELMLNLHRNLGGEAVHVAVDERLERDTVFVDVCEPLFVLS